MASKRPHRSGNGWNIRWRDPGVNLEVDPNIDAPRVVPHRRPRRRRCPHCDHLGHPVPRIRGFPDRDTMLAGRGAAAAKKPAEATAHEKRAEGDGPPPWEYIRVPGLGFLPGLLCPHHDRTQSNGVLRSEDFANMLARHPGETGIAIDHFAALVIAEGSYRTLALPGKPGSKTASGANEPGKGTPAVWLKRIASGPSGAHVEERALPEAGGLLEELLVPATAIVEDPRVATARIENPADDINS